MTKSFHYILKFEVFIWNRVSVSINKPKQFHICLHGLLKEWKWSHEIKLRHKLCPKCRRERMTSEMTSSQLGPYLSINQLRSLCQVETRPCSSTLSNLLNGFTFGLIFAHATQSHNNLSSRIRPTLIILWLIYNKIYSTTTCTLKKRSSLERKL